MANETDRYADAITRIESGGRYDARGPVTRSGDRAYGRYQVMGANIPSWTEAAGLGRMTPEQFLASPEAQDAVFRHRFGSYVDRYGPEGAAAAWFAGEGGMRDPGRRDVLGTSVADYVQRFRQGLGGAAPAGEQSAAPAGPAASGAQQPQAIDAIVADALRERDALARSAAAGAAADDTPLQLPQMQLAQMRVPLGPPRRAVTVDQLRAALPRRLGV